MDEHLLIRCCKNVGTEVFVACDKPAIRWYRHYHEVDVDPCSFCEEHDQPCGEAIAPEEILKVFSDRLVEALEARDQALRTVERLQDEIAEAREMFRHLIPRQPEPQSLSYASRCRFSQK